MLQTSRTCDKLLKYINEMGVGDFVGARFLVPVGRPSVDKVPDASVHDKRVDVNMKTFADDSDPAEFDEKAFYNKRRWSGPGPVGGVTVFSYRIRAFSGVFSGVLIVILRLGL